MYEFVKNVKHCPTLLFDFF